MISRTGIHSVVGGSRTDISPPRRAPLCTRLQPGWGCGFPLVVSARHRGLRGRFSRAHRVDMAEALSRSDTEVPSLFMYNGITPAEAGCKEKPTEAG